MFANHATDWVLQDYMDGHFQRKIKESLIAELVIEGTCPYNEVPWFEMLIFNNVLNPKQ